jgi:hypothetical protein
MEHFWILVIVFNTMRDSPVSIEHSTTGAAARDPRSAPVTISRWVNEPLPDFRGILCSRDVARLTRRPRWFLSGLALIGRFPRRQRYRGRPIGWQRLEILDWLTKGLDAANDENFNPPSPNQDGHLKRHPRQTRLPLECGAQCALATQCSDLARRPVSQFGGSPKNGDRVTSARSNGHE